MSTAGAFDVELVRVPGVVAERQLELSDDWFAALCMWLRCRVGELRPVGWPMVLIPEVVDRRFRFPEETLQVYHRVTWRTEVPRVAFPLEARVGWVSSRDGSMEIGLVSRAGDLADSVLVARSAGDAGSWGERDLPRAPEPGPLRRRRSLIISEGQVKAFADLAGTKYPVHDDPAYAQRLGYPTILVQGLVLLIVQMHVARVGDAGQAEMWFRRPVPAGSLLELCQSEDDPAVWAVRSVAVGEVAAVGRVRLT